MPKFIVTHTLPPKGFSRDQFCQVAAATQRGKCADEAPTKKTVCTLWLEPSLYARPMYPTAPLGP